MNNIINFINLIQMHKELLSIIGVLTIAVGYYMLKKENFFLETKSKNYVEIKKVNENSLRKKLIEELIEKIKNKNNNLNESKNTNDNKNDNNDETSNENDDSNENEIQMVELERSEFELFNELKMFENKKEELSSLTIKLTNIQHNIQDIRDRLENFEIIKK